MLPDPGEPPEPLQVPPEPFQVPPDFAPGRGAPGRPGRVPGMGGLAALPEPGLAQLAHPGQGLPVGACVPGTGEPGRALLDGLPLLEERFPAEGALLPRESYTGRLPTFASVLAERPWMRSMPPWFCPRARWPDVRRFWARRLSACIEFMRSSIRW